MQNYNVDNKERLQIMTKVKTQKGFTIIEVVLVLAIAGLILMLALVAYPALQRSQRNTERKHMASTVISAVNSYASNNRGLLPSNETAIKEYIPEVYASGFKTTVMTIAAETEVLPGATKDGGKIKLSPTENVVGIYKNARCGTDSTVNKLTVGTSRQFVVVTVIETGSSATFFCQEG